MKKVLITGAGSYIGTKVQQWLEQWPKEFKVDAVDTINDNWKKADFSQYDVVYNVAGIAHVKAAKGEGPLYYAINRDMIINIAKAAKEAGVKQFIHMSSMIVYKEVKASRYTRTQSQCQTDFMVTLNFKEKQVCVNRLVTPSRCVSCVRQ